MRADDEHALKVLTDGERLGKYQTLQDPTIPNGWEWYAIYTSTGVTLGVVR